MATNGLHLLLKFEYGNKRTFYLLLVDLSNNNYNYNNYCY